MQKKFKFRLVGVLKIRFFEEEKAKIKLGTLVKQKQDLIDEIEEANQAINLAYNSYQKAQNEVTNIQILSFFPNYIKSFKDKISLLNIKVKEIEKQYHQQLQVLTKLMGERKVIENLKNKQKKEFDKKLNKILEIEREDLFSITREMRLESE